MALVIRAYIGSIGCHFMKGIIPAPSQRVETFYLPGTDYAGAQTLGLGGKWTIRAVYFSSAAGVSAWRDSIGALTGRAGTIIMENGITRSRCLVTEVSEAQISPAGAYGVRGEVQISGVFG